MSGSALGNEVLIPLGSEVLGECIEYESRWLASLSDDAAQQTEQREQKEQKEQREETVKRIERLYGEWAKRCSQDTEVWVKYWWFERSNGQFEKAQKVYNRAVHLLPAPGPRGGAPPDRGGRKTQSSRNKNPEPRAIAPD